MEVLQGTKDVYAIESRVGGRGKFGGILRGTASDGKAVSIKSMEKYGGYLPQLLQKLQNASSPNLAPVIESFVAADGCLHVVRQYVEGTDLKTIFTEKKIYRKVPERKYVDAGLAVLDALDAMHAAAIIHRDVKPSNVVIPHEKGQPVEEADFGKAVLIDMEQCAPFPDNSGVRTPFALIYSPPEMLLKYNNLVGPWSDTFALSVMLFQLIMGKAPYADCNPEVLINLQLTYPMQKPSRMADELFRVLEKAAHKHPFRLPPRRLSSQEIEQILRTGIEQRYQTAQAMAADLRQVDQPLTEAGWLKRIFK